MDATARKLDATAPDQAPERSPDEIVFDARTRTLRGDIRDLILREFKAMSRPWQQMTETEQARLIHRANDIAGTVVRRSVDIVAEDGLPSLPVTVGKITLEGGAIKGAYECFADDENLLAIRRLQSKRAMFVLADPDEYFGQRAAAKPTNVGELAMPNGEDDDDDDPDAAETVDPRTGEAIYSGSTAPTEDRPDEEHLAKVGRGKNAPQSPA